MINGEPNDGDRSQATGSAASEPRSGRYAE